MAWGIALTLLFIPAYWLASSDLVAPFGHGYASLHILLELPAIAVSLMVFLLSWSLMYQENRLRRIVLGAGFLCIALVDLAHTMSYSGMPFFLAE
ncbi:MAG: diguanylate cyclase, partial [Spirochaetae bacterium HGW-Spirochaetae-10]